MFASIAQPRAVRRASFPYLRLHRSSFLNRLASIFILFFLYDASRQGGVLVYTSTWVFSPIHCWCFLLVGPLAVRFSLHGVLFIWFHRFEFYPCQGYWTSGGSIAVLACGVFPSHRGWLTSVQFSVKNAVAELPVVAGVYSNVSY